MVNLYEAYLRIRDELDSPFEAKELCCLVAEVSKDTFMSWNDIHLDYKSFFELKNNVELRKNGKPLAYILGEWEFYSLPFKVNENVLIPRPDTETLIDEAIGVIKENDKVLDICTGSGCIAITMAKKCKDILVDGIDISDKALEVARENASLNDVVVEFFKHDALKKFETHEQYDLIVSNPPYIPKKDIETLDIDVKDYEPVLALDGGDSGLDFYEAICENFKDSIKDGGHIIFEYGIHQEKDVKKILEKHGFENIKIKKDLCGIYRVIIGGKNG